MPLCVHNVYRYEAFLPFQMSAFHAEPQINATTEKCKFERNKETGGWCLVGAELASDKLAADTMPADNLAATK